MDGTPYLHNSDSELDSHCLIKFVQLILSIHSALTASRLYEAKPGITCVRPERYIENSLSVL